MGLIIDFKELSIEDDELWELEYDESESSTKS